MYIHACRVAALIGSMSIYDDAVAGPLLAPATMTKPWVTRRHRGQSRSAAIRRTGIGAGPDLDVDHRKPARACRRLFTGRFGQMRWRS